MPVAEFQKRVIQVVLCLPKVSSWLNSHRLNSRIDREVRLVNILRIPSPEKFQCSVKASPRKKFHT